MINSNSSRSSCFFRCSCSCSLKVICWLDLGFGKTELLLRLPKEERAPATPVTRTGQLAIQITGKQKESWMLVLPTPLVLLGWGVQNIFPAVCGAGKGATSKHAHHWGCVSALVTEHVPWELLQDRGSGSICTPGVLQANDEAVGSPGPVNQGQHWNFIHLMAPGHKKLNIFFRKLTCRDLKRGVGN